MDAIIDKKKASLSLQGLTFYNNHYNSSAVSGSSSLDYFDGRIEPKTPHPSQRRWRKSTPREITGYQVNKSLVKSKADMFCQLPTSRRFLAFYSISFPQGLPDEAAIKMLNIWLTRLRQLTPKVNYLWVAERQKNGTIHFHMLTDQFFNIRIVNYYMGKSLDTIRNDFPKVFKEWNYRKYNGVDVKRVFNPKGVQKYITKYIGKQNDKFKCRANGMSRLISALFTRCLISAREAMEYWDYLDSPTDNNPFAKRVILNDFAVWIAWKHGLPSIFRNKLNEINARVCYL